MYLILGNHNADLPLAMDDFKHCGCRGIVSFIIVRQGFTTSNNLFMFQWYGDVSFSGFVIVNIDSPCICNCYFLCWICWCWFFCCFSIKSDSFLSSDRRIFLLPVIEWMCVTIKYIHMNLIKKIFPPWIKMIIKGVKTIQKYCFKLKNFNFCLTTILGSYCN